MHYFKMFRSEKYFLNPSSNVKRRAFLAHRAAAASSWHHFEYFFTFEHRSCDKCKRTTAVAFK